jgi:uncharacterized membrane protein YbhN (UPF0104 family)
MSGTLVQPLAPPRARGAQCDARRTGTTVTVAVPAGLESVDVAPTTIQTETAIPAVDVRALARRAAVPAAFAAAVTAALIVAGGPAQAFADALRRALDADPRWVAAGAGFELASFAGYVALFWLVAGRATTRIDGRRAVEVTLGGAAATRLLPTGGAGGAALTLWALRRTGLSTRDAGRTLLTFLVLLYAVFLAAIATSGTLLALHLVHGDGPLTLSAIPAAGAALGIAISLWLALRRAPEGEPTGRLARVRGGGRLIGEATRGAMDELRGRDLRLAGAVAWWGFDAAVLWAMLHTFGAPPALGVVALAYFVGQVANTLPIPGAVSGGIVGILIAFGVESDLAIVSVLSYRAVAIWLPGAIGLAALPSLRGTLARWARENGEPAEASAPVPAPAPAAEPRWAGGRASLPVPLGMAELAA